PASSPKPPRPRLPARSRHRCAIRWPTPAWSPTCPPTMSSRRRHPWPMSLFRSLSAALAAALLGCAAAASAQASEQAALPELGLMGTIPIYWGEAGSVEELVSGGSEPHWVRGHLERGYALRPLDTLAAADLADLDVLLLAQPRALSPAENVALDAWVRDGGRLLLFADPMLTGPTRFAIGDRRRPQDVILLSPILTHWGLELQFDVDRPEGAATVMADGREIPINRPGSFVVRDAAAGCTVAAEGLLATCRIGQGKA